MKFYVQTCSVLCYDPVLSKFTVTVHQTAELITLINWLSERNLGPLIPHVYLFIYGVCLLDKTPCRWKCKQFYCTCTSWRSEGISPLFINLWTLTDSWAAECIGLVGDDIMGDNPPFVNPDPLEVEEPLDVEEPVSLVRTYCLGWIYVPAFFVQWYSRLTVDY